MADLISRQAAIETSLELLEFFVESLGGAFYENAKKELIARFQRLPSAETKTKCIAQIKIERDDMEDLVNEKINEIVDKIGEPKTGKWIGEGDGYSDGEMVYDTWYCSECDWCIEEDDQDALPNYCPNCGAKMKGEDDDL